MEEKRTTRIFGAHAGIAVKRYEERERERKSKEVRGREGGLAVPFSSPFHLSPLTFHLSPLVLGMARPRSILWIDDEIETLDSQVLFLQQQGFAVERAANGDDALALLRRQPYGVVLLDEQMPGTRGLDLVPQLRAIDSSMPVVMITKSEGQDTLRDAIGAETADYLIKPVSPRQVLSVVTRLLEGDRIRQQRLSRDFVGRFRELEGRRGEHLAWREWIELVAELADWEVKLGAADEPGLQEALRTLQSSIRRDFAAFIAANYPRWLAERSADRPPLSVDVVSEFLRPTLDANGKVMLVVVDCLRLDQWAVIRPLVERIFEVEVDHYFSILPTATPYSRNAIFSGLYPAEMAARQPSWWNDSEESSLNAHEAALLTDQLRELTGRDVPVHYEKMFSAADGEAMLKRLPGHLSHGGASRRWYSTSSTSSRMAAPRTTRCSRWRATRRRFAP